MLPIKRALLVAALFSASALLITPRSALAQDQDHDRGRQGDDDHDKDHRGNGHDNGRHNGDKHRDGSDGNNNYGSYNDGQRRDGNYPNNGYPNNGYPNNGYPNNGYPNNGYPNNGYPNGNYNGVDRGQARSNQIAYNNGRRAGSYDAQRDVNNHRSGMDYTKSQRYGDAGGWNAQMGDRNQYKQAFRQGYAAGYQQTYNQRGYGR
jgi:hypothetical protein